MKVQNDNASVRGKKRKIDQILNSNERKKSSVKRIKFNYYFEPHVGLHKCEKCRKNQTQSPTKSQSNLPAACQIQRISEQPKSNDLSFSQCEDNWSNQGINLSFNRLNIPSQSALKDITCAKDLNCMSIQNRSSPNRSSSQLKTSQYKNVSKSRHKSMIPRLTNQIEHQQNSQIQKERENMPIIVENFKEDIDTQSQSNLLTLAKINLENHDNIKLPSQLELVPQAYSIIFDHQKDMDQLSQISVTKDLSVPINYNNSLDDQTVIQQSTIINQTLPMDDINEYQQQQQQQKIESNISKENLYGKLMSLFRDSHDNYMNRMNQLASWHFMQTNSRIDSIARQLEEAKYKNRIFKETIRRDYFK
ncbi:UNKNOWN [Stylonychia lemnae]|uniref:Uncharacterized protein n=1 Tax=Stylonychia lemnae TaxID=5949 RepID=A0A078A743_STYLE|nr:UNKNOWN [Stylonychia lemnae]|eukprot:CDW78059.1 UNKNOWN [Stylonychia lemnae]